MSRGLRLRATAWVVATVMFTGVVPGGAGALCAEARESKFIAPVQGPIVRRFEPPPAPYAAGHRGIDFGVPVGTEVVASGDGIVLFAGPVADDGLFITIAHDEFLQTTYSFLSQISVSVGQEMRRGEPIGLSGSGHPGDAEPSLHFGAKFAGQYIDPEILLFGGLDDISDLISLAPVEDEYDEMTLAGAGGMAGGDRLGIPEDAEPKQPWHVKLGSMIAGLGRSVKNATLGVANWTKDKALKAGQFVGGMFERVWEGVGSAFSGAKKVARGIGKGIGDILAGTWKVLKTTGKAIGDFFVAVGRGIRSIASQVAGFVGEVGRWISGATRWIGDRVAAFAKSIGRSVSDSFDRGMGFLGEVIDGGSVGFVVGMGKGVIEQVKCSREGGAPPPDLPTTAELSAGAKPPAPPNDNIVVAIAGIGSHTAGKDGSIVSAASMYQLDFKTLGYTDDQVFFYSYKGLEDRGGPGPYQIHTPYSKEDTYESIVDSAELLRDQIEAIHRTHPDKRIDLVAHSQGGLVAQYYTTWLYDLDNEQGPRVEHLVTIAAPHQGADAAQLDTLLSDNQSGRLTLRALNATAQSLGLPPPSSPAAREMAEDSTFIVELNQFWDPQKVKTTTVTDTFDFVVSPQHARLRGAANYTVDMPAGSWRDPFSHHGLVVSAPGTQQILYSALGDTPSECTALRNAFADYGAGRAISAIEDTLGALIDAGSESLPLVGQFP